MKTTLFTSLLSLCGSLLFITTATADPKDTLNAYDVKFVKEAAQAGLNEVKIAELGSMKATNPELKSCAVMLVKDHTAANLELKALGEKKGVKVSGVIDEETAQAYKKLEKQNGDEFDKSLIEHLDKDHGKCIKSFEGAQKDARDSDLRLWVDKTLIVLKAHHATIKSLKK